MNFIDQPLQIKGVTLKNRIGMSPMCMYSSNDGFATDWHFVHYGTRAVGGAALIMQEATAVTPIGRITPGDLGIWKDEHIPNLKKITDFIKSQNAVPGIQLAHAGRKASHETPGNGRRFIAIENGGWQTAAPSAIPFSSDTGMPKELSQNEIQEVIELFVNAAERAMKVGYKIIEIHAAHGYLLHEFLSPISNHRTDNYGGSFENRIRIVVEVVEAVRNVIPAEMPLFVRVSSTDWVVGGWTIRDTVKLADVLKTKGVDLMDCSSGGNSLLAKIPFEPLYQVPFAEAVKQRGIMSAAVGLITTTKQINTILKKEQADIILLGRELLRNPYFPIQVGLAQPVQYTRGV